MILFGGSFDPFHNGHFKIVQYLLKNFNEKIIIIPQNNKNKKHKFLLTDRTASIKYLFKNEPKIEILEMGDNEFFFYEALDKINTQENIKIVIGDDVNPKTWSQPDKFENCQFITINRLDNKNEDWNIPNIASSTIKKCDDIIYHNVPKKIWHYFCFHELVNDYFRFTNAVDIIVYNKGMILLTTRGLKDIDQCFVLPGGHIDQSDQSLEDAICRELMEETSIHVDKKDLKFLKTYGDTGRDPRKRVISTCFYTEQFISNPHFIPNDEVLSIFWIHLDDALKLELGFDHKKILEDFKEHLKQNKLLQT